MKLWIQGSSYFDRRSVLRATFFGDLERALVLAPIQKLRHDWRHSRREAAVEFALAHTSTWASTRVRQRPFRPARQDNLGSRLQEHERWKTYLVR